MNRLETIERLIDMLLQDMPQYREQAAAFPSDQASQRRLLRSLMNVREPGVPLRGEYVRLQDKLLSAECDERGAVDVMTLPATARDARLVLWQGDITRLAADAIVNAANSAMLGCFIPCHGCIDNAIHSAAGLQLREECVRLMRAQGHEEPTGRAKITQAYNLPARHVIHTVGPIVQGRLTERDRTLLASCYRSCLELAAAHGLQSVAFCCISTGEFRFPHKEAAEIAVSEVRAVLDQGQTSIERVVFNVFKDEDLEIYRALLGKDA